MGRVSRPSDAPRAEVGRHSPADGGRQSMLPAALSCEKLSREWGRRRTACTSGGDGCRVGMPSGAAGATSSARGGRRPKRLSSERGRWQLPGLRSALAPSCGLGGECCWP
eukprot:scaffold135821_cov24-Tisochrysis_lutea.AAC.3